MYSATIYRISSASASAKEMETVTQVREGNGRKGKAHVWFSPLGLKIHAARAASTTMTRPMTRLHLCMRVLVSDLFEEASMRRDGCG
jgi:hypothetical protein